MERNGSHLNFVYTDPKLVLEVYICSVKVIDRVMILTSFGLRMSIGGEKVVSVQP